MADAIAANPKADVVVNFASLRSAEEATLDILKHPQYGGHIYFLEVKVFVEVFKNECIVNLKSSANWLILVWSL